MTTHLEEPAVERLVKKTPWWAISAGLHTLAVLVLMFLVVAAAPAEPEIYRFSPRTPPPEPPDMTTAPVVSTVPYPVERAVPDPVVTPEQDTENETENDQEFQKAKGDPDAVADQPLKSRSWNASIGAGGDAGGRQGTDLGGRRHRRSQGQKGPKKTGDDEALMAGLMWLARHQGADGAWGVQSHTAQCGRGMPGTCSPNPESASADFDTGVTGLAVLAFLGAGYSHLSKDTHEGICFGDVVRRGLQALLSRQEADGAVGPRSGHKDLYNHSIATLALAEAFGLTGSPLFRENAQRAVDFLVAAQNPGKGWRYSSRSGDNDTSVTGWAVMALKSAELSGLGFPRTAYDGARAWLNEATEESYARTGYAQRGTGKVYCAHNAGFDHHEALTSIAVMSRIFMDRKADAVVKAGAELVARDLPEYGGTKTDYYAWYYAALALFQYDGPAGSLWTRWNRSMLDALVKPQNTKSTGCKAGSWEPSDRWSCEAGRVYATAINCLTLEVYYRYENVLGGKRGKD